jgi:hypothetical protein
MQGEELTYLWHKDGQPLDAQTATLPHLLIQHPRVEDSGRYHVIVRNSSGAIHSAEAVVNVSPEKLASPNTADMISSKRPLAGARRRRLLDSKAAGSRNSTADTRCADQRTNFPKMGCKCCRHGEWTELYRKLGPLTTIRERLSAIAVRAQTYRLNKRAIGRCIAEAVRLCL